jgi:drug/metabolite transporter (DMT)-like permease
VSVVGLTQVGFGILLDVVVWQRALDAARLLGVAMVVAPTAWLLLRQGWQQADEL